MGSLWMGIATFMHDCTHDTLSERRWKSRAFGIFPMIPLLVTFVSFMDDHLAHHRYDNYHIGHHVHPGVPWYSLKKLHLALRPELAAAGATVDAG